MKTIKKLSLSIASALMLLAFIPYKSLAQNTGNVSFQLFYDELAPYGQWINDAQYGYIWIPDEGRDFRPYASNGNWVVTSYGNTWVSNYPWGWAPFHYGRWNYSDYYGWAWVPGYEWGPAWVNWRNGGGYYGWAPLLPGLNVSVNVNIPSFAWNFVPQRYICSPYLSRYYAPHRDLGRIYNSTTIINNTYVYNNRSYISGPSRHDLERATRSRVNVRDIRDVSRPGRTSFNERSVSLYRPAVERGSRNTARPSRVTDVNSVMNSRPSRTSNPSRDNNIYRSNPTSRVNNTYPIESGRTGRSSRTEMGTSRSSSQERNNMRDRVIAPAQRESRPAVRTESARPSGRSESVRPAVPKGSNEPAHRESSGHGRSSRGR
ncbi:hypothetical protein SAMN05216436_11555 [bacterium A37T11]|nr:hypothetical protein SAMN05216436_11555 [bacterium A37T11]